MDTLDAPLDPANANRYAYAYAYAYAANDPINNSDPLGLFNLEDFVSTIANFGGAGGVIGTGVGCATGAIPTAGLGCAAGAVPGAVAGTIIGGTFGLGWAIGSALAE